MKKLISLLLVIIIICAALVGCKLDDIFGTTTTVKRIPPSERDPGLDELELDYSDNFDEFDVEFVKSMYRTDHWGFPSYEKPTFEGTMRAMKKDSNTVYKLNIDINKEPYFLAVYETPEPNWFSPTMGGLADLLKWCKYDNYEEIPSQTEDWILLCVYAVYDCVVEKDILNDVVYNQFCKYYVPLTRGYLDTNVQMLYGIFESVAWLDLDRIFGRTTPISIKNTYIFDYQYGKDVYKYYMDENGVEYLVNGNNYYSMENLVNYYWKH